MKNTLDRCKPIKQTRKEFLTAILTDKNEHAKMLYNHRRVDGSIFDSEILTPYFKAMIKACYAESKIKFFRIYLRFGNNKGILLDMLQNCFNCDDDNSIYLTHSNMI